jgi:alanyl-tRNA synthetase
MIIPQRRFYYESDDLEGTAVVQRCFIHEDKFVAILDTTLFHPQGGGQLADTGWLNDTPVVDAKLVQDEVWLWLAMEINIGEVNQRVNAKRRYHHSLLHSAGHLLGNAGQALGLIPVKAHHWPNECKVTFRGTAQPVIDTNVVQATIDKMLATSMERSIVMSNGVREVAFGSLPAYPCGGTHIASTKQISKISILTVKQKNGEYSISYTAEPSTT